MSEIVQLNVGGKGFSTSRHTLLWNKNSFFTILLSGRLPSCKDEGGAYFIDRDPDHFSVILNYLRSGELNPCGLDLATLKNEAQFYGLDSLVRKLSLCEENFYGACGDLLFHAYMPCPDFSRDNTKEESNENNAAELPGCHSESGPSKQTSAVGRVSPVKPIEMPSSNSKYTPMANSSSKVTLRKTTPNRVESADNPTNGDASGHAPDTHKTPSTPATLIACYQNLMVVVYKDRIGLFYLKDPTGWRLVWLSSRLPAPVDRLALTGKTMNSLGFAVIPSHPSAVSSLTVSGSTTQPVVNQPSPTAGGSVCIQPNSHYGQNCTSGPSVYSSSEGQNSPAACTVACAMGSTITLWNLFPPRSSSSSAVASYGTTLGVYTTPAPNSFYPLVPCSSSGRPSLIKAKKPWAHDVVGRYDLNGRAVDYLFFIEAHLVALSRRGLVGVRHVMTNMWQVWSTMPILSYSVAASELLLLGCANGCIYSINIQKFPIRIVDNDLLVTEMYRDPLQDPITALCVHITKTVQSGRSLEIAYGTLSGRVCLIVQYPENVGYSPQLLQTFTVHRAMVTRVVLSEKHLITVCNELNHVRTWAVPRFRGIISTQPGSTPIASFHVTALDTDNPQNLVDSVINLVTRCSAKPTGSQSREVVRAHSQSAASGQPTHADHRQTQSRHTQLRPSQTFRFPQWRRHGSQTRPSAANGSSDLLQQPVNPSCSAYSPIMSRSSELQTCESLDDEYRTPISEPTLVKNIVDAVTLPRTSWLHEDSGAVSSRTSLANGSRPCTEERRVPEFLEFPSHSPDMPQSNVSGRCQTYHGISAWGSASDDRDPNILSSKTRCSTNSLKSVIGIHRYGNDPGPYGEREDVLVFVQKLTPSANQLFIRLASNGRRVCIIRSVDGTPITTFTVHEHDGSNRVGAHPRRYVFTGHTDGSIQVWDLTTALASFKPQSGFGVVNPSSMAVSLDGCPNLDAYNPGPVYVSAAYPPFSANSAVLGQVGLTSPGFPAPNSSYLLGGPTSREVIRLLEFCHLGGTSSATSSANVTPSDSLNSVCCSISVPSASGS